MNVTVFAFSDIESEVFQGVMQKLLAAVDAAAPKARAGEGVDKEEGSVETGGGRPFEKDGLSIPHGTELLKVYKGKTISAVIDDAGLLYNKHRYEDLTPAAVAAVKDVDGENGKYPPNGWTFWRMLHEG